MRDAFLERLYFEMQKDSNVFLLTADFGAPVLDKIRADFADRFINVGISEQNLINVAAGLGLEGFRVFTYAIAPFYLRAFEQVRNNFSLLGQLKTMNINMIAVGAGCSYAVSGPSHHCFEDIAAFRILPNIELVSPSDPVSAAGLFDLTKDNGFRYFRFDAQKLDELYTAEDFDGLRKGYSVISESESPHLVLVTTGFMTTFAKPIVDCLVQDKRRIRHIDLFRMKEPAIDTLKQLLCVPIVISMEEGFANKGGMDAFVRTLITDGTEFSSYGVADKFIFTHVDRISLLALYGLDQGKITCDLNMLIQKKRLV